MPYEHYAQNPQTGEYVGWDGAEWKPVHPREVPGTVAYGAMQRQPAMRDAEARSREAVNLPSFESATALSALSPGVGVLHGLASGDWRIPSAQLSGVGRGLKSLVTPQLPSRESTPFTSKIVDAVMPDAMADVMVRDPRNPLAAVEQGVNMARGLLDTTKQAIQPSVAYFGEDRAPTEAENLDALSASSELGTTAAAPYVAGPVARAAGRGVRAVRTRYGVKKPSAMMNTMLAEGAPREIAESLDRSMDRTNYTPQDPRIPGQSDVGLRVLDEVGVVGDAATGAAETRARLNTIHEGAQQQLQRFSDVQIPSQEIVAAIRDPIARRLRDAADRVSTANPQTLTEMMDAHFDRFMRETGGRTDPATINQYKASLYELLNSSDFKKAIGADPSLHGILREQANGLMQLVNRYTVDPQLGVSPVAELNRAYSDLRPGLDAYEGLILRDQTRRSSSNVIAPSGFSPEGVASAEARRGVFSGLSRMWNSPARVTLSARALRTLAPPVPQSPPYLPPETLPALPESAPTLPPARSQLLLPEFSASPSGAVRVPTGDFRSVGTRLGQFPELDTTVFSQSTPDPIAAAATAATPAPEITALRPTSNLAAEHARLIAARDAIIGQEAQAGVEGQNHNLRLKEIAASRNLPTALSEPASIGDLPVQPRASQSTATDASAQAAARARLPVLDPALQLGDQPKAPIAPKQSPKPSAKPSQSASPVDYSTMSEADLRTQLSRAEQARDTARKMSPGSNDVRSAEARITAIKRALESRNTSTSTSTSTSIENAKPKRISALRRGRPIEGIEVRSFNSRGNGRALVLRADDGSERLVFESEVT